MGTNCQSWIALIIAPTDILYQAGNGEVQKVDTALLDGDLADRSHANRRRRNRPRWDKQKFRSPRDADYFQTCLIEVGMRKITEKWCNNIDRATEACHES